jgi:hypothetical protein
MTVRNSDQAFAVDVPRDVPPGVCDRDESLRTCITLGKDGRSGGSGRNGRSFAVAIRSRHWEKSA